MNGFIEWLEGLNGKDTRVRAVLRRSLAFEPGRFAPAYSYVEPFIRDGDSSWRRKALYLVAALWAVHWRQGRTGTPMPIGRACASYQSARGSTSMEHRFIALLDADQDQLPYRLRQMIALLKDQAVDFEALLKGLLYWNDDQKRIQNAWARDFYRNMNQEKETEPITKEDLANEDPY